MRRAVNGLRERVAVAVGVVRKHPGAESKVPVRDRVERVVCATGAMLVTSMVTVPVSLVTHPKWCSSTSPPTKPASGVGEARAVKDTVPCVGAVKPEIEDVAVGSTSLASAGAPMVTACRAAL